MNLSFGKFLYYFHTVLLIGIGRERSKKKPPAFAGGFLFWRLAVTYSRTGTPALPSAMHRFTAEFDMESGGSNALLPPGKLAKMRSE